jgi:hypothetical protein
MMKRSILPSVFSVILMMIMTFNALTLKGQGFLHPGIDQSAKDLAEMKRFVAEGREPYKAAFQRMKESADKEFTIRPHTHVLRGPYAKPNIGGEDLMNGARMAYDCALMWYLTGERRYADKSIGIINAWSSRIWDFDYNDAKLLAGLTGYLFCNAAEILRYTDAGWKPASIDAFSHMLMTVHYPLLRQYFPTANGNWNGAIIHSLLAIGIFTDNREIFSNAVDNFLHAPVNGGIFKYIYPNGQCQESPRDQGHVQLGLDEFSGAARIAFTQGVDLFSIGDDRIALGFEYTARFLFGENPHCYCTISEREKRLRDNYEYVYRHYAAKGVEMPWTKRAADSLRQKAGRSVLTAVRASFSSPMANKGAPKPSKTAYISGATTVPSDMEIPAGSVILEPGQSIQQALDALSGKGLSLVLKNGIHTFPQTLKIPSGITIRGEGIHTILHLDPASGMREAMVNADIDMHDVTIRDLVIEVSNRTDPGSDPNTNRSFKSGYNRGGILFRALREGQMKNIALINLTVRNATFDGVHIAGAEHVRIDRCDFSENGSSIVPGPRLQHNLLLRHVRNILVSGCRLVTSPYGCGVALDHCDTASVTDCEIARNGYFGLLVSESRNISASRNLIEANDRSGVMMEFLHRGSMHVKVHDNVIRFNTGYGVESHATTNLSVSNNAYAGNGNQEAQEKIGRDKTIIMQ